jgi:hypothetical protein
VLEQEDALPSAELQPSVGDGDAELGLGQRAFDVGRHVVRPFVMRASVSFYPRAREGQCLLADPARSALARSLRTSDL